jgi:hypothetical protein
MIGAPSRQPAVDRLVPPRGWDDGVVGLLQADSNSTTLMSGTFNVERRIHRKLRLHPNGSRVALGIDPVHVYNFGIPGMGLEESALTLRHAVFASRRLRLALIGLDFMMFNANREVLAPQTEKIAFDPQRLVLSE